MNKDSSVGRNVGVQLWDGLKNSLTLFPLTIFLVVVVGVGGLGIWIPMFTYKAEPPPSYISTLAVAFATYYLAMLATLFAELTYEVFLRLSTSKHGDKVSLRYRPSTQAGMWFIFFGFGAVLLTMALLTLTFNEEYAHWGLFFGISGTIVGLILWLTINGEAGKFSDKKLDVYYNAQVVVDDNLSGEGVPDDGTTRFD